MAVITWKFFLILCTLPVFLNACGQKGGQPKSKIETHFNIDTSTVAIISFKKAEPWWFVFDSTYKPLVVSKEEINEVDSLFKTSIVDYNSKLANEEKEYWTIDLNKFNYRRQYVFARNKKGEKEVYINCFCDTMNSNWKHSLVIVDDGGNCFFNLKINLTTKKYYDFFVNGVA